MRLQGTGLIIIMAFITVGAMGCFIALYLLGAIHTAAPQFFNSSNPVGASALAAGTTSINYFDTLLIFIFMASVFVEAISGSQVRSNPAFAFVGFLMLPLTIILAVVFHNLFFTFVQSTAFGGNSTPLDTDILFEYLPVIGAVGWLVIMGFTFASGGTATGAGAYGSTGNYGG